jgi:hypothetical protein
MIWATSSGQFVHSKLTNDTATGLFHSTVNITATTSDIPVHRCDVTIHAPTSDFVPPGVLPYPAQATNVPSYSRVATSSAYSVQYCPQAVTITLFNGSVAEQIIAICSAKGGSSSVTTTFTWTNTTNGDILSNGPNVTIPVGDYNFTCSANSTVSCGVGSTKTCDNLNKTISGTASDTHVNLQCYETVACILQVVAEVVGPFIVFAAVILGIFMYIGIIPRSHCAKARNRNSGVRSDYHNSPRTSSAHYGSNQNSSRNGDYLNSQATPSMEDASCQVSTEMLRSGNRLFDIEGPHQDTSNGYYRPYMLPMMRHDIARRGLFDLPLFNVDREPDFLTNPAEYDPTIILGRELVQNCLRTRCGLGQTNIVGDPIIISPRQLQININLLVQ